jgi:transposase
MSANNIAKLKPEDAGDLFSIPNLVFTAKNSIEAIIFLREKARAIEKEVKSQIALRKEFELLKTVPGIGDILGLTIMLEVGDIRRFFEVGNYSSYCRCVNSTRIINGKKKGENNRKNGNKYLSWAYVEAANFARRYCDEAQRFYQRKMAKTNNIVATKALSNKICRASYYVMRDQVPWEVGRVFK